MTCVDLHIGFADVRVFFKTRVQSTSFFQEPEFQSKTRVFSFSTLKGKNSEIRIYLQFFIILLSKNFQTLQIIELG